MANSIFVPQLIEAGIQAKLGNNIVLYPIADVRDLGNVQGGNIITVPTMSYIGDATVVTAGATIPASDFTKGTTNVDVVKYAKSLLFTQEDVNNAYGDVMQDAEDQLSKSLAGGIETAMFEALEDITGAMLHTDTATAINKSVLSSALVKFGEDVNGEKFLLVNPTEYASLRNDSSFVEGGNVQQAGSIYGCEIIVAGRVPAKTAYIVKRNALGVYLSANPKVETAKNISNQTHEVVGTVHAGVHIKDASGAIKIKIA